MTAVEAYGQHDGDVTLTGLAGSLKVLRLAVDMPHEALLRSLMQCSKVSDARQLLALLIHQNSTQIILH
jgi:hypothetical protein